MKHPPYVYTYSSFLYSFLYVSINVYIYSYIYYDRYTYKIKVGKFLIQLNVAVGDGKNKGCHTSYAGLRALLSEKFQAQCCSVHYFSPIENNLMSYGKIILDFLI